MTFSDIPAFVEWLKSIEGIEAEYEVVTSEERTQVPHEAAHVTHINHVSGMTAMEIAVTAYDSGFDFGALDSDHKMGYMCFYEEQ